MKRTYRNSLLVFLFVAMSLLVVGLSQGAGSSVPCHECDEIYSSCMDTAYDDWLSCEATNQPNCLQQRTADEDACDLEEGQCYANCFECEFGPE